MLLAGIGGLYGISFVGFSLGVAVNYKLFPEVSERAFWETRILAMKCAKLLQT